MCGSVQSSFKLGLIQLLGSWTQVLYHPLLVSLNPTYPFGNNTAFSLKFSPLFHGRKLCVSCQDPKPHFSWCDMMFLPHAFPEELSMLSASWMAVLRKPLYKKKKPLYKILEMRNALQQKKSMWTQMGSLKSINRCKKHEASAHHITLNDFSDLSVFLKILATDGFCAKLIPTSNQFDIQLESIGDFS